MPAHTLITTLKLLAACHLVLALATSTRAEQPSALPEGATAVTTPQSATPRATVGDYYFDGWAGKSDRWKDDPAWTALNPPTHLTKRMIEEFADREPIWGWRDDSLAIMERQIDLAADHGIAFFAFCWYWNKDPQKLDQDPKHTGLKPTLSVSWDKRPWEGERGLGQKPGWYFPDRTPDQLAAGLESAIAWMDQHPDQTTAERIVLLYAWNEFGEGGYLAPTKGDPEGAYLKAVKQVVERK
ncbi:MAG: glycoside hydrolase family 99-like domain-containing protein [Planctomycetota bacterium]|nr:glycoside hydrolase family 99-like domain-containing protein [Planctomycetota bacterium]